MSKKKSKNTKTTKKKGIIFVAVLIFVLSGVVVTVSALPSLKRYSDENTQTDTGIVTDIYIESHATGYKTRKRATVYIELDHENVYYIANLILRKNDCDYETLKSEILGKQVEIKSAKDMPDKLVAIQCDQNEIIGYEQINQSAQSDLIGVILFDVIAVTFAGLLIFL